MGSTNAPTSVDRKPVEADRFASAFAFASTKGIDRSGFLFSYFIERSIGRCNAVKKKNERVATSIKKKKRRDASPVFNRDLSTQH